ncbi:alpha/beta fold hydrolase [Siphonobacter sp. SORGH_AS_1065]|uniref:alpha/beta fold hydrolase n=1 Tax=Siphonobacter sp. SORGH_AS_1065 TaxID=3041795 RepID=UPI0027893743|nr:alpha/beta hydrolase [Siphonobacter sp. SORGH_AS_1065]MDQ1088461.1 pimeloyl-ACP methyl ester carboxylesterase [Siphonobacter sp. SORGH_AS_1065]
MKISPFLLSIFLSLLVVSGYAQEIQYPYPVHIFRVNQEQKTVDMAYMDIPAQGKANGKTALLFHGKNFNGIYWREVIAFLSQAGYRVIVPDQVGWGKSSYPDLHYSFHALASTNKRLLDSLNITKVTLIAHSMGGMLATRFTLMFPEKVHQLILENPIGLEDYRIMVPYAPLNELYTNELSATYESYKKYQQSYYPQWKPEYEEWVKVQASALKDPRFKEIAWVNALTYQMIYEQPVCYEFNRIRVPTLLIIGQEDRTIVGKNRVPKELVSQYGQYPALGKRTQQQIKGSKLVELPGVGHIPHIQDLPAYTKAVLSFLK